MRREQPVSEFIEELRNDRRFWFLQVGPALALSGAITGTFGWTSGIVSGWVALLIPLVLLYFLSKQNRTYAIILIACAYMCGVSFLVGQHFGGAKQSGINSLIRAEQSWFCQSLRSLANSGQMLSVNYRDDELRSEGAPSIELILQWQRWRTDVQLAIGPHSKDWEKAFLAEMPDAMNERKVRSDDVSRGVERLKEFLVLRDCD